MFGREELTTGSSQNNKHPDVLVINAGRDLGLFLNK